MNTLIPNQENHKINLTFLQNQEKIDLQSIDHYSNGELAEYPINYCTISRASFTSSQRNGWTLVKQNIPKIVEYGRREGLIGQKHEKEDPSLKKVEAKRQLEEELKDLNKDSSFIHSAIPYLPVPAATLCCILNFLIPGSGTLLSGIFCLCMGQTRIGVREGKVVITLIVNTTVAVAQLGTVTFFLVGWFWSIAWGGLLFMHSLQYRETVIRKRQVTVATAAIEALTNNTLRRRRKVAALVDSKNSKPQQHETKNSAMNDVLKSMGSQEQICANVDEEGHQLADNQNSSNPEVNRGASETVASGDAVVQFSLPNGNNQ